MWIGTSAVICSLISSVPIDIDNTRKSDECPIIIYANNTKNIKTTMGIDRFDEKLDVVLGNFNNIINKEKVKNYLLSNNKLTDILTNALAKIKEIFPKDALLQAEVYDFMDETGGNALLITIQSSADLYDKLQIFEENWWFDNSSQAHGKLIFTV